MREMTRTISAAIQGVDVCTVEVEVNISNGKPNLDEPKFSVIGLPDASIRESKDRVKSAIVYNNYRLPEAYVTINLAPAGVRKSGAIYDLPIALCLLAAADIIPPAVLDDSMIVGELALNGDVRGCHGILPMAMHAKKLGLKRIFVPRENAVEAATIRGIDVYGVKSLKDAVIFFKEHRGMMPTVVDLDEIFLKSRRKLPDFIDVKGQESTKRAMLIAAAGAHNILMIGQPGVGKSLIANRLPSILPLLTIDEALEVTKIYSIAGELPPNTGLIANRPFRSPHHTVSDAGLMGGGQNTPRPGEITLSHCGILFLDELPEFRRNVLEALRQPMENGNVTIARASGSFQFPARFMLVAAMNPCPCGYYGSQQHRCTCSAGMILNYRSKISGPLLDRMDLHIEVPPISENLMTAKRQGVTSVQLLEMVIAARERQRIRLQDTGLLTNSQIAGKMLDELCRINSACVEFLKNAIRQLNMSPRAYDRILRVSRTIADLENSDDILPQHVSEAMSYRVLDRQY